MTKYYIEDTNSTSYNIEGLIAGYDYVLSFTPRIKSDELTPSLEHNVKLTSPGK